MSNLKTGDTVTVVWMTAEAGKAKSVSGLLMDLVPSGLGLEVGDKILFIPHTSIKYCWKHLPGASDEKDQEK